VVSKDMDNDQLLDRGLEVLRRSYAFLFKVADRKGHWGETRCTALAATAVDLREDGNSQWLKAAKRWLLSEQISDKMADGSWGEEVWDTAMAVISLKDIGMSSRDPALVRAINWLSGLFSRNGRANWHDEPWETSWALMAILKCGYVPNVVKVRECMEWLASLVAPNGLLVSPHYSAYFLQLERESQKASLPADARKNLEAVSRRCSDYLLSTLRSSDPASLWMSEAWANGQILWMLCCVHSFPVKDAHLVDKALKWFETNQNVDGSFGDVEDTACAIIGLYKLMEELDDYMEGLPHSKHRQPIEKRFRKTIPVPPLHYRYKLFAYDPETQIYAVQFSRAFFNTVATISAIIGFFAAVVALWQYFHG
jgi:hypothetical protein